jgi:hypothetical protein
LARGVTEASASGAFSAINFEIIDLDATELPSNDRDIYEVVLERMLANPVESEVEVPEPAAPVGATSDEVAALASGEPTSGATVVGQLTPGQGGEVGGLTPHPRRRW